MATQPASLPGPLPTAQLLKAKTGESLLGMLPETIWAPFPRALWLAPHPLPLRAFLLPEPEP